MSPRAAANQGDLGAYMFFVCIMFGYDALAGSVVISVAEFRKDFGFRYGNEYVVSAAWQLGFQAAFFAGQSSQDVAKAFAPNGFPRNSTLSDRRLT